MALPPTARASLLSFLTVHYAHSPAEFARRYKGGWLVWEPDKWAPPARDAEEHSTMGSSRGNMPKAGDALCYELVMAPGQQLTAGRHKDCELLIDHATFSRRQLALSCTGPGVYAVALGQDAQPASHRGAPLTPTPRTLTTGDEIVAGDVKLVFFHAADFHLRLADEQARSARR
ncbi:MAG: FHA domain-containing protein [Deltaproteobacteria bacterium]|nr:FHA domain-containing protein [Deltaproteobacteria bacterium]